MFSAFDQLSPELVWGLFSRGLGLIYLISFTSLSFQIVRACSREGGMPIARRLDKIKEDFPGFRRFLYFPTLLWVSHSDWMLRALTLGGLAGSLMMIYGGPLSVPGIVLCYVCYLSLDLAIGLIFPWDSLLFEATVLGFFLPQTHALPDFAAASAPAPALTWAYRLLLFRVMFGFGKQKFMGSTSKDLAYLKGFLVAQPLPSKLGWYHQKLPGVMLKGLVLFMFFAEIPVPFFFLFPGDLSIVGAFVTMFLMVGIQAMGSFGYFSMLTMVGCIPLFDNVTPTQLDLGGLFAPGAPLVTNAFVLVHTFGATFAFLFNSWVAQCWHMWSTWYRLPLWLGWPFSLFRALHQTRWLHPYGVFPPNTGPGVKMSLLVEVSWDEKEWHELEFTFSPSNEYSAPRFVAPHHPRGDQAVIYETFGLNPTSLISGNVGPYDPYAFGTQPAANVLVQRILEGKGADFMRAGPLAEHAEPPLAARVTTIMLEPASLAEHRATGKWWRRTYVGPHTPPRRLDPLFWEQFLPEPELWHFDAIMWRRRSKLNDLMKRARAGEDADKLVLESQQGLDASDVEAFWSEFIPAIRAEDRRSFDTLADVVPALRERFDRRQMRRFNRLLGRYSALLVAKLEPMYLGRLHKPLIPATTYFHLWMVVQDAIADGKEAYLAAYAEPLSLSKRLADLTPERGLYLLSIFRFESMVFEAQKLRLVTVISPPHDDEAKKQITLENMKGFERTVAQLSAMFSGFFSVMPAIRDHFKGPRFDQGFPERYPSFEQLDSGEVVLRSNQPKADGAGELPVEAQ